MSHSIHNTNVEQIKIEVNSMLDLLNTGVCKSETILKNKYNNLFKTSPTLFNFILKNYKQNSEQLQKNIDMMLDLIGKIQKSEISQYDASVVVGQSIGEQYIPQLKK